MIGSFLVFCAVSCHPIGPPQGNRSSYQPAPGTRQPLPAAAQTGIPSSPGISPDGGHTAVAPAAPVSTRQPSTTATSPNDSHPTAEKAPGRPGYVLSPHTGKLILVEGIPSGQVVPDQTCPPGQKKFFRVP